MLTAALAMAGCFNPFLPRIAERRGVSEPPPTPNTARGVIELFSWCWNNRAYEAYTEIFTEDFEFRFGTADSAGNAYRGRALYRQDELDATRHLFVEGTDSKPPASRISLIFQDRTFVPQRDSRPGKEFPWHQEIKRTVVLSIDTGDEQFRITGSALFFVVRGDSARISADLVQRGFRPDVNRWYIERWEDETVDSGGGLLAGLDPTTRSRVLDALREGQVALSTAGSASATSASTGPLDITWGALKHAYFGSAASSSQFRAGPASQHPW